MNWWQRAILGRSEQDIKDEFKAFVITLLHGKLFGRHRVGPKR